MFLRLKKIIKIGRKENKTATKPNDEYLKNGIRNLASDDEIFEAFSVKGVEGVKNDEADSFIKAEEKPSVYEKKYRQNTKTKTKKKEKKMSFDKNGLPLLDNVDNYFSLMEQGFGEAGNLPHTLDSDTLKPEILKEEIKKTRASKKILKTRHGIAILKNDDEYSSMFNYSPSDEDFNEILAKSLGAKSEEVLLKEKSDKMPSGQKLTVKQRLSRYPLPQGQLDLHGYTAIKADLKAEAYLKKAFYNGTYTVRIIVGKGLHSEDGPVLPDVIESRILKMKTEKTVYAYEWDKKKKSKSGAVTVFLNNYHT